MDSITTTSLYPFRPVYFLSSSYYLHSAEPSDYLWDAQEGFVTLFKDDHISELCPMDKCGRYGFTAEILVDMLLDIFFSKSVQGFCVTLLGTKNHLKHLCFCRVYFVNIFWFWIDLFILKRWNSLKWETAGHIRKTKGTRISDSFSFQTRKRTGSSFVSGNILWQRYYFGSGLFLLKLLWRVSIQTWWYVAGWTHREKSS